jgi:hypothetical protein
MERDFQTSDDYYRLNQLLTALDDHGRDSLDLPRPFFVCTIERRDHGLTIYLDNGLALEVDKRVTMYQICRYEWIGIMPNRTEWIGSVQQFRIARMERDLERMIAALVEVCNSTETTK